MVGRSLSMDPPYSVGSNTTDPILLLLPSDAPMMIASDTWWKVYWSNTRNKVYYSHISKRIALP